MSKLNIKSSLLPAKKGFTLVELMVAVAVLAILTMVALPSLSDFSVRMRVDNEISELNRLLLTARNVAINEGVNVTVCPLVAKTCTTSWGKELSVFTDFDGDGVYEPTATPAERIIKVKSAIKTNDKLQYSKSSVMYASTGLLASTAAITPLSYCPYGNANRSRGIMVSSSGRIYSTSDTDNDDKDEDRSGNEVVCS